MLSGGALGLAVGAILGLTGAGGGVFAVPALVFGLDMDMRAATPVALAAVGMAAGLGALQGLRQGIVRYRAATVLAATGAITAPLGIKLAHWLPVSWLNLIFVIIMLVVAYRMAISSRGPGAEDALAMERPAICKVSTETRRFIWGWGTAATLGSIGAVTGVFTGMLGVGGGFIIVPALSYFTELRMQSIVSTSLMVVALLSTATIFAAGSQGAAFTASAWAFVIASLTGMALARLFASRIPSRVLQRIFAVACVAVAAIMLMRSIG